MFHGKKLLLDSFKRMRSTFECQVILITTTRNKMDQPWLWLLIENRRDMNVVSKVIIETGKTSRDATNVVGLGISLKIAGRRSATVIVVTAMVQLALPITQQ